MTETHEAMNLRRLEALLDAHGADPARWPAAERAAAQELLAADPAAQKRLHEARRLDRALDRLPPAPAPAADLAARIRAVALQQNPLAAPAAPAPAPIPANGNRAPWRFTAALAASALIGLWLGFASSPFTVPVTAGDTASIDLAALDQQDVAALAFGPLVAGQNGTGDTIHD